MDLASAVKPGELVLSQFTGLSSFFYLMLKLR
ncbi:MAG: hypothetical protein ACJA2P_001756 [Rhodoferax sp.]|jgi:hypothetical protein